MLWRGPPGGAGRISVAAAGDPKASQRLLRGTAMGLSARSRPGSAGVAWDEGASA